jgi:hypothetical protein
VNRAIDVYISIKSAGLAFVIVHVALKQYCPNSRLEGGFVGGGAVNVLCEKTMFAGRANMIQKIIIMHLNVHEYCH